jgi:hypothetical protein
MRKMLSTTVESSNKQLASALGEIAAIKKAVQMLSATTFKNRVSHCFRWVLARVCIVCKIRLTEIFPFAGRAQSTI